jgi:hypothetical protein
VLGFAGGVMAVGAFCVLATAGLPILTRYLLLPGTLLAIFCGAAICGWTLLDRDDPWRVPWMAFGGLVVVLVLAFTPSQLDRLRSTRSALVTQTHILGELHDLSRDLPDAPARISVPNRRAVPQLALWTDRRPADILSAQELGRYVKPAFVPASPAIADQFVLDARDKDRRLPPPPPGHLTGRGRYWLLFGLDRPSE